MATNCETEVIGDEAEAQEAETTEQHSLARQLELEHYGEIKQQNDRVMMLLMQWTSIKNETSEAKKRYDEAASELHFLIQQGPAKQAKLFNSQDNKEELSNQPPDAWRKISVEKALSLSIPQYDKLAEAGASTMGALENLRAGAGLRSIKGFGEATVDKIEDQIIDWLDENRDRLGEVVEEDESEDEEAEEDLEDDQVEDDDQEDDSDLEDL